MMGLNSCSTWGFSAMSAGVAEQESGSLDERESELSLRY